MFVIGLTGGLGSGKSTVAEMLRELGAEILNADQIGHQVYAPGGPAYRDIIDAFGTQVLAADGTVDRRRLASIVFQDPQALQRLNAITHPRIREAIRQRLQELAARGVEVAVLEAALLLEAGWDDLVDEVWVTVCPPEVAARRAAQRSGISMEEALARVRAQMPVEERARRAQVIIHTDTDLEDTRRQVEREWARLKARLSTGGR
ncbi:MAG: dephospho-CoA kinase [Dehalococcoidia bacterium]|nr:dephospho-CoA kinase [Dehalococcoidia bacterium]MDW8008555.1 dephospho-CoA kinase [Chloroflexota bacterium]